MSVELEVTLRGRGPYGPGDHVQGHVRVLGGGQSRSLSVSLQFRERSPGYTHVAHEVPGPILHSGALQTGALFEFAVPMPEGAVPGQQLRHGETFWQIDVKSDEPGPDTHATVRVPTGSGARTGAGALSPPPPPPPPPPPVDGSGTPLLTPGYSASAGRSRSNRGGVAASILAGVALLGYGAWQAASAFDEGEARTYTVPAYTPPPVVGVPGDPGGSFDLFDCFERAANDPSARTACIQEHNRRITEER